MNRRDLILGCSVACSCGSALAQTPLTVGFTWDYYDPVNMLLQDVGDLDFLPTSAFATGLPYLPVGALPNIAWYALQDLPGLMSMTVGQIPGLQEELARAGYTLGGICPFLNPLFCSPRGVGTITPETILNAIPELNWDYFINFPSIQSLLLGQITFTDASGVFTNLFNSAEGLVLSAIPGLAMIPFYTLVQGALGRLVPLFSGVFPAMVEMVASRLQGGSGAIFAVDRGHPWYVGEYRYLAPNLRVRLDTISTERPGTATFHLEILVCVPFFCFWTGPFPWPSATEQNYALYIPTITSFVPSYPVVIPNLDRNAPANPGTTPSTPGDCSGCYGVAIAAYAKAISSIEGGYGSVGPWQPRYRSYPLGRYQYLSSRSDVRPVILQNSGGSAFLAKVDAGIRPTAQEVLANFTPTQQDALFRTDTCNNFGTASRQTDPTTGRSFMGRRLVERAAQIHFGGPSTRKIDSGKSDNIGRLSIFGYGKLAASRYYANAAAQSCPATP